MLATNSSSEITQWRAFYQLEQQEIEEAGRTSSSMAEAAAAAEEYTFGEGV